MPAEAWEAMATSLPTVIVAVIAGVAGITVAVLNRGGARENAMIDQLQEQVESLGNRLDAALRRERIRDDYIHTLRDHIDQGRKPPSPPWPEGLTN